MRRPVLFFCGALGVISSGGVFWALAPPPRKPLPSPLVISDAALDFGKVSEQPDFEHWVTVQNTSASESVEVVLDASCNCTSFSPETLRLGPGQRGRVKLMIDLTHRPPGQSVSDFEWPFQVRLAARAKDSQGARQSRQWKVTGIVQRWLAVDPPAIHLSGPNEIVQGDAPQFTIIIRARVPLAELKADLNPETGTVAVSEREGHYELEYLHWETSQLGEFESNIRLRGVTEGGTVLPEVNIPVTGRVAPPFRFTPSHLVFPPAAVGRRLEKTVSIASVRGVPFRVEVGALPDGVSAVPVEPRGDGISQSIVVAVDVPGLGSHAWDLPLRIDPLGGESRPTELTLSVRAHGVETQQVVVHGEGKR